VHDVLKALQPLLPIRFEKVHYGHQGPWHRICKDIHGGQGRRQAAQGGMGRDGSWIGLVEIPAGIQLDLISKLQAKTKGQVETRIVK